MTRPRTEVPLAVSGWVQRRDDFVIVSHLDPDGDSLGSSLALTLALDALGKRSSVVIRHPLPPRFEWLPSAHRVQDRADAGPTPRAVILAECSDFARCGVGGIESLESLNIDHHSKNSLFADVNWVDPSVASAGMMIRRLIESWGGEITPEMATLLYVTVLTDTGSFRHSNTDADALQFAADMVRRGANPERISGAVYGDVAAARVQLMADALGTLRFERDGGVAWMVLRDGDFRRRGTRDTEGFINLAQEIAGVSVSFLFKEFGDESYRVSMRSDGAVDVAEIAALHGGGGHARAAGCQLVGDLESVRNTLMAAVVERLGR